MACGHKTLKRVGTGIWSCRR
ncbi:MAG: hypothetical protein ACPL7K_05780, partial [Armatimonadota bacterium]